MCLGRVRYIEIRKFHGTSFSAEVCGGVVALPLLAVLILVDAGLLHFWQ